jgi:hypothetical protein
MNPKNILIVLAYHQENAPQCERLLDHLYALQQKRPQGHLLLCFDLGVHAENKQRIQIAAELAFNAVYPLELRPLADPGATKVLRTNNVFRQAAQAVEEGFQWSFLWLEPDCTPINSNWLDQLWDEYHSQPRPFYGNRMQVTTKDGKGGILFMARPGIYPRNAHTAMPQGTDSNAPYEIMAGSSVTPRLCITKRIQQLPIKSPEDIAKVRNEAVLVHGDKLQLLLGAQVLPQTITVDSATRNGSAPEPVFIATARKPDELTTAKTSEPPRVSRRQKREAAAATNRSEDVPL